MKCFSLFALLATTLGLTSMHAQNLYTPGGVVGNSGNSNVGIGTAAPAARLHVGGSNQEIRFDYNGTNNYYGSLRWAGLQLGNNGINRIVAGRSVVGGLLDFYVNNTNDAADNPVTPNGILAMRLAANGNVGIGTMAPGAKLHIDAGPTTALLINTANSSPWGMVMKNLSATGNGLQVYQDNSGFVSFYNNYPIGANITLNQDNSNVGIGTINPTQRLSVNGTIRSKEVIVETTGWSDYVLAKDYTLQPLSSVEEQIERDGHLPGIPSAREVAENGIRVGAMQAKLLAKIEELTLHQIALEKRITVQDREIVSLRSEIHREALTHSRQLKNDLHSCREVVLTRLFV